MDIPRKIRRLELAVLHLSKAVNDLIDAQKGKTVPAGLLDAAAWREPEEALRDAHANIERALEELSGER